MKHSTAEEHVVPQSTRPAAPADYVESGVADKGNIAALDTARLADMLRKDAEFQRLSRNLTARLRIRVGSRSLLFVFQEGELTSLTTTDTGFDTTHIVVDVPENVWEEMMRAEPRPFYQDFWSAKFHHGVRIEGDFDLMTAYYGAIRRIGQLSRAQLTGGFPA